MEKFSKKFKLILYEDYKSCKCYESEEEENRIPLIKGFYINEKGNKSFGYLPNEINLTIEFYPDRNSNEKFMDNFYKDNFSKGMFFPIKKNQRIENGILFFKDIIEHKKLMENNSYRKYFGNVKNVKDIYIHKDFLKGDAYPEKMLIKLNWKYNAIIPPPTDQLSVFGNNYNF